MAQKVICLADEEQSERVANLFDNNPEKYPNGNPYATEADRVGGVEFVGCFSVHEFIELFRSMDDDYKNSIAMIYVHQTQVLLPKDRLGDDIYDLKSKFVGVDLTHLGHKLAEYIARELSWENKKEVPRILLSSGTEPEELEDLALADILDWYGSDYFYTDKQLGEYIIKQLKLRLGINPDTSRERGKEAKPA